MPAASSFESYNARVSLACFPPSFRRAIRIGLLGLHLVWGVALAGLVFPLLGPAQRDRRIMAWSRRLLGVLGVQARTTAAPGLPGGALLVCNHVSWLDIYLIYAAQRVHFVSKAEVRSWPVAGWLAHKTGTLFIERGRRADTARINAEMRALMEGGAWVAVFPEGTTSDGRGLRRFMPSLLQPAVELNCPIVPAALRYRTLDNDYSAAPAYIDDISMWQSLKRIVGEPGLIAELRFGEPIPPNGHRRELAAQAEAATAGLLGTAPASAAAAGTPLTGGRDAASADTARQTPGGPPA
ncbi:MAG: 1-acyl-sn-glycerol-3-phosphate acyltransferase [Hydrogenophilales bacterium 17-64-11]|nr:MAG: 1-acyl-sn-glycerol-3-phosphate acyltransferase [Hydrogenophilales bacterium 17-64-11]